MSRPLLVKTRISSRGAPGSRSSRFITQSVGSGGKRKPRRRTIRSNRLAEAVQEEQAPSYKIQPPQESARAPAAPRPPGGSGDRAFFVSVFSGNSEFMSQKFLLSFRSR